MAILKTKIENLHFDENYNRFRHELGKLFTDSVYHSIYQAIYIFALVICNHTFSKDLKDKIHTPRYSSGVRGCGNKRLVHKIKTCCCTCSVLFFSFSFEF